MLCSSALERVCWTTPLWATMPASLRMGRQVTSLLINRSAVHLLQLQFCLLAMLLSFNMFLFNEFLIERFQFKKKNLDKLSPVHPLLLPFSCRLWGGRLKWKD